MKKILIFLTIIFFNTFCIRAQKNNFLNNGDYSIFKSKASYGWVNFKDNISFLPENVFQVYSKAFSITDGYSLKIDKISNGANGYMHYKYKEYYNGIVIDYSGFNIHAQNGFLVSGSGDIYTGIVKSSIFLTENMALNYALQKTNDIKYYWQDAQKEQMIKTKQKNNAATYFPKAEKVYLFNDFTNQLVLTYKFTIRAITSGKSNISYVDATNGVVIKQKNLEYFCDPTTVVTNWYGVRPIFTNDVGVASTSYDLEDDCTASVFQINDATNGNSVFNTGGCNACWNQTSARGSAATSLWTIKQTFNTFKTFFNRNGHDNNDGNIDVYQGFVFSGGNNNNAGYLYDPGGDDEIYIGAGDNSGNMDDWNTLDIMAHEFTHGVTQYSADLIYQGESGALNESFSDIFGEWVESKFRTPDWLIGADRSPGAIRSFINPSPAPYLDPNTYLGANWKSTAIGANDFGGVHSNSGVQNHMFYLLVNGGNGWNDGQTSHAPIGSGYEWSVNSIGMTDATAIAYKALNQYLYNSANYQVSRACWVQAAIELFGPCSYQAIQVGKAWYAVGMPPPLAGDNYLACNTYGISNPFVYSKPGTVFTTIGCNTLVSTNANQVVFKSGTKVVLRPGFTSANGSKFSAIIDECRFAAY
jgi:bacillolysin